MTFKKVFKTVLLIALFLTFPILVPALLISVYLGFIFIFNPYGEPTENIFYVGENDESRNGRELRVRFTSSNSAGVAIKDSTWVFSFCTKNLYTLDTLSYDREKCANITIYPLKVHRASGRTDTLFCHQFRNIITDDHVFGYVRRDAEWEDWLVCETKLPGLVMDSVYITHWRNIKSVPWDLSLSDFSYKGQKLFFETEGNSFYWIAHTKKGELHGPLSESELVKRLKELQIPLPLELDGRYDRYTFNRKESVHAKPKEYSWLHHRSRTNKIICE